MASDDERDVRARVATLLAEHADDDQTTFLGAQFDAGLARVHYPAGQGGLDLAPKLQEVVDTELAAAGRTSSWLRNPMGIGMVGPTIVAHGTDEQRAMLRSIWTAEEIWCQMFSEPGAGSDVATLATRAVRDGDVWIVNGQKVWTSLAHRARWGMLLARTDPDVPKNAGLTAFILDMHAPGVEVRPLRQMTGGADFNEVYFTDVQVPDSARLGGLGDGWHVAVTTLMNERVSIGGVIAPRGSGPIAGALDAWAKAPDRNPARRDDLMRLWVDAEVLRLSAMRASALRERGTPGPEGSVLKMGGALLDQRIQTFTVSTLGPTGTLSGGYDPPPRDDPVDHFLASQSETIAGGTTQVMRNILGERVLGLPAEAKADRDVPWSKIPKGV
ncbi:MAG: acyl-CoA dehydrogenase family protein [Acidimicrobiia bacterium]|nr:acyl-CoA dehydrogenase family protein [Acidimicrobiia bacterium]